MENRTSNRITMKKLEVKHDTAEYPVKIKIEEPVCDLCGDTGYVDDGEDERRCPDCNYKRSIADEMDDDSDNLNEEDKNSTVQ